MPLGALGTGRPSPCYPPKTPKSLEYLAEAVAKSDVVIGGIEDEDKMLALVTCSYQTSNSRTVVYAKEVEVK